MSQLRSLLVEIFTLDLRSLGLMRIALGLLILYNLWTLFPDIGALYGHKGIGSFPDYIQQHMGWSVYELCGDKWFFWLLFFLHVFFGLLLTVGLWTKAATAFCWLMTMSQINRLPAAAFGGDYVLRAILMWGMFLPLGSKYSIDSLLGMDKRNNNFVRLCNPATACFIGQLIVIFVDVGYSKNDAFWGNLTALYFDLGCQFARPLATHLMCFPLVVYQGMALFILLLQRWAILLLLVPKRQESIRTVIIGIFFVFHLAVFLLFEVSWFSFIMWIFFIGLVPSSWWNFREESTVNIADTVCEVEKKSPAVIFLIMLILMSLTSLPQKYQLPFWFEKVWKTWDIDHRWRMFATGSSDRRLFFINYSYKDGVTEVVPLKLADFRLLMICNKFILKQSMESYELLKNLKAHLLEQKNKVNRDHPVVGVSIIVKDVPIILREQGSLKPSKVWVY